MPRQRGPHGNVRRLLVPDFPDDQRLRILPQDGRIDKQTVNARSDLRVATYPTVTGEKIVLRLFSPGSARGLAELEFPAEATAELDKFLRQTAGLLLLTGPAGSRVAGAISPSSRNDTTAPPASICRWMSLADAASAWWINCSTTSGAEPGAASAGND